MRKHSEVHGTVAPGFEPVRDAFRDNLVKHGGIGASCCAIVGGETVVNLWGGLAQVEDEKPSAWGRGSC